MLSFTTDPYDYYGPINYFDIASSRLDRVIDSALRKASPDETHTYIIKVNIKTLSNS